MARKGSPRMITGARAEDTFPDRDSGPEELVPRVPQVPAPLPELADGKRRFQADAAAYRLQLKCTRDTIVQGIGTIPGESIAVQFSGGYYETDDPVLIELITKSKSYGLGKSVWDANEMLAKAQDNAFEQFVAQVEANPRLKARLAADPRLKSFAQEGAPAGA